MNQILNDQHAGENYQAAFALPELDGDFTDQPVLLATMLNGKTLPMSEGPYRIIAPHDKRHSRWVKDVKTIWVTFADTVLLR